MTTTQDPNSQSQQNNDKNAKKPAKPKGPIRWEAVIPVSIVMIAGFLYFHFLFDRNLRSGIEFAGTYLQRAEVNVSDVNTSFLNGSLAILGIQVTDKENPNNNLIAIDDIRFDFSWDALLRLKFVVDESGVNGISMYSPRKSPGKVLPPEPPNPDEPGVIGELQNTAIEKTKTQFKNNVIGDLAALLGGTNEKDILKSIEGQLKSEAKIQELKNLLKEKEVEWKKRIDSFPRKDDFKALEDRAKKLKFNTKDPSQFAADLKEAKKIAKEADAIIDEVRATSKKLKGDVGSFDSEIGNIDDLIKQDIADLQKRMNIPDLDTKQLSQSIFGSLVMDKLGALQKYYVVAKKYMPPKKSADEKPTPVVPPKRGDGKTYKFAITTGYPLFWLKKATLSSKSTAGGFSGDLNGTLTDVTSDPGFVKKPAVLDVKGGFPKAEVSGVHLNLTVDHIDIPKNVLSLKVGSFPVNDMVLSDSSDVGLAIKRANGSSNLKASIIDGQFQVLMNNEFTKLNYDINAKAKKVTEILNTILNGIPVVTVNASVGGTLTSPDIHINSNLGDELSKGVKAYVSNIVNEKKKEIQNFIDTKIKGERQKLNDQFKVAKGGVDKSIDEKTSELEKAKGDVTKSSSQTGASNKDKMKDELKEKGKKLLKGLKF
jgi:uncharacterized protein (TIGR03545 family)